MDETALSADTPNGLSQDAALAMLADLPDPEPIARAPEKRRKSDAAPAQAEDPAGEDDSATVEYDADDYERAPEDENAAADDADADEAEDDSNSGEELFTVKVDGEEFQVTREELIAGYQKQQHVTRTSQALAREKDQFEQARAQAIQHYDSMLNDRQTALATVTKALDDLAEIRQELEAGYVEPDWRALAITLQPHEYNQRHAEWVAAERDRLNKLQKVQAAEAAAMEESNKLRAAKAEMTRQKLVELLPGLRDPGKFDQFRAQVRSYAVAELGFKPEELSKIVDPRPIMAMYKAMKYDALVKGQRQPKPSNNAPAPARAAPPALKPGAAPAPTGRRQSETSRDMKRLRETGDQGAALRLLSLL